MDWTGDLIPQDLALSEPYDHCRANAIAQPVEAIVLSPYTQPRNQPASTAGEECQGKAEHEDKDDVLEFHCDFPFHYDVRRYQTLTL
jgi:hypothetical protein